MLFESVVKYASWFIIQLFSIKTKNFFFFILLLREFNARRPVNTSSLHNKKGKETEHNRKETEKKQKISEKTQMIS